MWIPCYMCPGCCLSTTPLRHRVGNVTGKDCGQLQDADVIGIRFPEFDEVRFARAEIVRAMSAVSAVSAMSDMSQGAAQRLHPAQVQEPSEEKEKKRERESCQISCCATCPLCMHDVHYPTAGLESTRKRVHAGFLHLCL